MFQRHHRCPDPRLREALVERYLPLARHVTTRFDGSGRPREDLFQVACLALVKAVDRFDPDRGVAFSSYAVPTMVGALKRHLRDETWALHVPRDLQDRALRTRRTAAALTRRLGRSPTVHELATALECGDGAVLEALRAGSAYPRRLARRPVRARRRPPSRPQGAPRLRGAAVRPGRAGGGPLVRSSRRSGRMSARYSACASSST